MIANERIICSDIFSFFFYQTHDKILLKSLTQASTNLTLKPVFTSLFTKKKLLKLDYFVNQVSKLSASLTQL